MNHKIKIGIDERTGLFILLNSVGDPISRPMPKTKIEEFLGNQREEVVNPVLK